MMFDFYIRVFIYFFCFIMSLYALNALDFNRFVKQGRIFQAQLLYFLIACALAYLSASFLMAMIYYFYQGVR